MNRQKDRILAIIVGIGAGLLALHNPYTVEYIHIPSIGLMLLSVGSCCWLIRNYKEIELGKKIAWIPIAVIALSISTSGVINQLWATVPFGLLMFLCYLVARKEGQVIFSSFIYLVILGTVGIVLYSFITGQIRTGGYVVSPTNYDIAGAVLIIGTLVSVARRQYWLSGVAIVGLFLTGAEEVVIALAILAVVLVVRRDWSKKILIPVIALVAIIVITIPTGMAYTLYYSMATKVSLVKESVEDTVVGRAIDKIIPDSIQKPITDRLEDVKDRTVSGFKLDGKSDLLLVATGGRINGNWTLSPIKPFGYGFNMTHFYVGIPHNIILIIIEQAGIAAAVAWLFVIGYCLVKTKWKYVFVAILALGIFDHFIWTQIAPWWWIIAGVATREDTKSDLIFKEV